MTLCNRLLHIKADDMAVVGLQKQLISGIILRVGILVVPGPGMVVD